MLPYGWIKMLLLLMVTRQLTGAVFHSELTFTIREGNDVTLPCQNVMDKQDKCNHTNWLYRNSRTDKGVMFFEHGKIRKAVKTKSHRMSIAENCSLVIRKVIVEDTGHYYCRQFAAGRQQRPDALVIMFVFDNMKTTATTRRVTTTTIPRKTTKLKTLLNTEKSKFTTLRSNNWPISATTDPLININSRKEDATNGTILSFYIVQIGDDITLPSGDGLNNKSCESITWIFSDSRNMKTVTLLESGQFLNIAENKSNRLFITPDCSLVIKDFSLHDVGCYTSRNYFLEQQQGPTIQTYVSVVHLAERRKDGKVSLVCSMLEFDHCIHSVKWMFEGGEETSSKLEISESSCSSTVTFTATDPKQKSKVFKCKVMNYYTDKVQLFVFKHRSSAEKSDVVYLIRCIVVPVGLAALIISTVIVDIWTITKVKEMKTDGMVEKENDEGEDPVIYEQIQDDCTSAMLH